MLTELSSHAVVSAGRQYQFYVYKNSHNCLGAVCDTNYVVGDKNLVRLFVMLEFPHPWAVRQCRVLPPFGLKKTNDVGWGIEHTLNVHGKVMARYPDLPNKNEVSDNIVFMDQFGNQTRGPQTTRNSVFSEVARVFKDNKPRQYRFAILQLSQATKDPVVALEALMDWVDKCTLPALVHALHAERRFTDQLTTELLQEVWKHQPPDILVAYDTLCETQGL